MYVEKLIRDSFLLLSVDIVTLASCSNEGHWVTGSLVDAD